MTDALHSKFERLQEQLTTQHGETQDVLAQILAQLGGVPPEGTATLQDVVDAISALATVTSDGFSLISGTLRNIQGDTSEIVAATIGTNNSVQAGNRTLVNIYTFLQTYDWCCGSGPQPVFPPPLSTVPIGNSIAKCQNVQLTLDILVSILTHFDDLIASSSPITSSTVLSFFTGDDRLNGCPKPSQNEIDALTAQLTTMRTLGIEGLGAGLGNHLVQLRDVLYNAESADEAHSLWIASMLELFPNPAFNPVYNTVFYAGLFNCLYSNTPGMDGSAYDGGVCQENETGCILGSSIAVQFTPDNGYGNRNSVVFAALNPVAQLELGPGVNVTTYPAAIMTTNINGGVVYYNSGRARIIYGLSGASNFVVEINNPGDYAQLPNGIDYLIFDDFVNVGQAGSGPFSVLFCYGQPA